MPSCAPEVLGPHMVRHELLPDLLLPLTHLASPAQAEFVAKEFAHAGAMRIANVRIGHLDEPSARFSTTTAEAVDFIASVVRETEEEDPAQLDWNDEG